MKKRKKTINKFIILSTLVVLLSSCGLKVREDLKEFTKDFSIDTCMEKYKAAEFEYVSEIVDFGVISASRTLTYSFNMKIPSSYESTLEMTNKGLYITSSYPEYKYSRITKCLDGTNDYQEMTRANKDDIETVASYLSEDSFIAKLKTFYRRATEEDGGNTAGMYYGDDIKARFLYQDNMRIDTKRNILIYEMNNVVDEEENVTSLYYEVNPDGMLLYWRQTGFTQPYLNPDRTYFAQMKVTYS